MTVCEFRKLPTGITDILHCEAHTVELTDEAAAVFCASVNTRFRPASRWIGRKQGAPYLLQHVDGSALGRDWMEVYDPVIARSLACTGVPSWSVEDGQLVRLNPPEDMGEL